MKIEVLYENFKKALQSCEKITRKITTLPVLQNVLLKTEGNFLEFNTTNLETSIKWWVLSKIERQGQALVPANFLVNLINLLSVSKLELKEEGKNLILISKDQEIQIQGQNPDEFPIIPKIEKSLFQKIPAKLLEQALSHVVDIPSLSQIKPEISGVYFNFKKGKISLVATDSFRLAEKTITISEEKFSNTSFILPQQASKELLNILTQADNDVFCYVNPNQVLFEFQNNTTQEKVEFYSRLIEGNFPNYQEVINKKRGLKIQLQREEFISQVKKAGLFSSKLQEIKITSLPKENKLKVFSQSVEIGRNESYIPCKITGKEVEVAFNYRFLLDGLNNIRGSEVLLELSENEDSAIIRPVGDETFLYVLMPIKAY